MKAMKPRDLITTLLEENGYQVEENSRSIGGGIHGWTLTDNLFLWMVQNNVVMIVSGELASVPGKPVGTPRTRKDKVKKVTFGGRLCITDLHHPNSVDIIQSWFDNIEHLVVIDDA